MSEFFKSSPMGGSCVVSDESHTVLFGQPPELLKGLLKNDIRQFDTLVLLDTIERDGSLLNNLEFPLYFFLFFSNGLAEHKKLNLVGSETGLKRMMEFLRLTLFGANEKELEQYNTPPELAKEWLAVSNNLSLKDEHGHTLELTDFFNLIPFNNNLAEFDDLSLQHLGIDQYLLKNSQSEISVKLPQNESVQPAYDVAMDYVAGGMVRLGLEVLGGASGFAENEPCTGIALCHNGDYLLIDSIPFLDQHLYARGIAKNQIQAVFLTHLHDDHCSMFPLMLMPHRVDIITTIEIFIMATQKLAWQLGWQVDDVAKCFNFIQIKPNETINYFGLNIKAHVTVHSIPTIGAVFSMKHLDAEKTICVIGDNHSMSAIKEMVDNNVVRKSTYDRLQSLFADRFDLLVADGGAGAIHGDPIDALQSKADRIVFVHVEKLPEELTTTFSLASSGKRYTLLEGDDGVYTAHISRYLSQWLGSDFPSRWMSSLLAEREILRFNRDDVIIVQDAPTKGCVYLVLSGYCEVIHQKDVERHTVAELQAGDVIGEMASITGIGVRNASVIARTPMTVCALKEETLGHFIRQSGQEEELLNRWKLRPHLKSIPQFISLSSIVIDKLCKIAILMELKQDDSAWMNNDYHSVLVSGSAQIESTNRDVEDAVLYQEMGYLFNKTDEIVCIKAQNDCEILQIKTEDYEHFVETVPQFHYAIRKQLTH